MKKTIIHGDLTYIRYIAIIVVIILLAIINMEYDIIWYCNTVL